MPDKSRTPRRRRFPYVYQGEDHHWYVLHVRPFFNDGPFDRWVDARDYANTLTRVRDVAADAIRKLS